MAEDLDREAWHEFALYLTTALRRDGAITATELERIRATQLEFATKRPGSPDAMRAQRVAQLADFLLSGTPAPNFAGLHLVRRPDDEKS